MKKRTKKSKPVMVFWKEEAFPFLGAGLGEKAKSGPAYWIPCYQFFVSAEFTLPTKKGFVLKQRLRALELERQEMLDGVNFNYKERLAAILRESKP